MKRIEDVNIRCNYIHIFYEDGSREFYDYEYNVYYKGAMPEPKPTPEEQTLLLNHLNHVLKAEIEARKVVKYTRLTEDTAYIKVEATPLDDSHVIRLPEGTTVDWKGASEVDDVSKPVILDNQGKIPVSDMFVNSVGYMIQQSTPPSNKLIVARDSIMLKLLQRTRYITASHIKIFDVQCHGQYHLDKLRGYSFSEVLFLGYADEHEAARYVPMDLYATMYKSKRHYKDLK